MAWETIANVKTANTSRAAPNMGVTVNARAAMRDTRYIQIAIGAGIAKAVAFSQEDQRVRLMVGSGSDAGKVAIAVDQTAGAYLAKRQKNGSYKLSIKAKAAEGLFSLNFPQFSVDRLEAIRPQNGQPPMFCFKASPAMLAVEDE